jgi:hypothetical protein
MIDLVFILSVFGKNINSLQLCQCIRELHGGCDALDRTIVHTIYGTGVVSEIVDKYYGHGIPLNDILDAEQSRQVAA